MRHFARILFVALIFGACGSRLQVSYDREHCYINGSSAAVDEVESQQSRIAQHVLHRQPIQTAVTVLMLLLAGAGYIDKLALLIAARRTSAPSFGERVRLALERHRPHPVRYFGIVTTGLVLVMLGAGLYISLDADKRASERALQQLQFCHLALRGAEEQSSLEEQRRNLEALQSTAGNIKALVDGLPPEEQRKAEVVLDKMHTALGNQDRMLTRETAVAQAVATGSAELEKRFGALQTELGDLKPMEQQLGEMEEVLGRLDGRTELADTNGAKGQTATAAATTGTPVGVAPANLGEAFGDVRRRTDALGAQLNQIAQIDCAKAKLPSGKTVGETLAELAARSPVCRCECAAPSIGPTIGAATDGGAK